MNVRYINLGLKIAAGILAAAAILATAVGLAQPIDISPDAQPMQQVPAKAEHPRTLPPVDSFSPLFARSLQTSVGAAASLASSQLNPAPQDSAVAASQLTLVGTVGNSLALIKGPDGSIAMIEAGDDVNGSPVLAIRPSQVDLRINGKLTTLQMAPPPDDSAVLQTK